MDSHLAHLLSVGVLTGSNAFNCATEESDWDIVILASDYPIIAEHLLISDTDFTRDCLVYSDEHESRYGVSLSDHEEFEDEPFIEYDQHTIWGPLQRISKYQSPQSDAIINLFVYEDCNAAILPKFRELNNLMVFLHGTELADKQVRIEHFTHLIDHVGITNF
jgi:hypothetical protein